MRELSLFFLLIGFSCFPYILVVNTYDGTCFIPFENVFLPVEVEENLSFFSKVAYIYEPPDIKGRVSIKLPRERLIVLENGKTVGISEGDIRISKTLFERLVEDFRRGIFEGVRVDRFPIEIYSIENVSVKESIDRNKFVEFLSYFFKEFEVPKTWIIYGNVNVKPKRPVFKVYPVMFPDFGAVVFVKIIDDSRYNSISWKFDGKVGSNIPIILDKDGTLEIRVKNEFGLESTRIVHIETSKTKRKYYELEWELGEKLTLPKLKWFNCFGNVKNQELIPRIPGIMNLFGFNNDTMIRMTVVINDKTPPRIELTDGKIRVHDMTAVNLMILCDGEPSEKSIPPGKHVVYVKAIDTYGNESEKLFLVKNPYTIKMKDKPKVIYLGKEVKIKLCDLTLRGHVLYGWSSQSLKGQVNGVDLEIEVER